MRDGGGFRRQRLGEVTEEIHIPRREAKGLVVQAEGGERVASLRVDPLTECPEVVGLSWVVVRL